MMTEKEIRDIRESARNSLAELKRCGCPRCLVRRLTYEPTLKAVEVVLSGVLGENPDFDRLCEDLAAIRCREKETPRVP